MSEVGNTELKPIDYTGVTRMVDRRAWVLNPRTPVAIEHPISFDPDPAKRIQTQGIEFGKFTLPIIQESPDIASQRETYKAYAEGDKAVGEKSRRRASIRAAELERRNLEAQGVLLSPDNQFYGILKNVGARIAEAEKGLISEGIITRTDTTDQYSFYVSLNENVNAYTFNKGKAVFFETGLLVLLDKYLKETKGYGLSEDHLGMLLSHEVSHSDMEAKIRYLNEEYCDSQGVILGARAGYNPRAAIDVEDFLIWYHEGNNHYKVKIVDDKKEKAILPTHPNPKNRRLVILNMLQGSESAVPNQLKSFTQLGEGVISDLEAWMKGVQEGTYQRLLPRSEDEIGMAIDSSRNISELLGVRSGIELFRRAEITRQIGEDSGFVDRITLLQAIYCELQQAGLDMHVARKDPSDNSWPSDLGNIYWMSSYEEPDLVIGGVATNLTVSQRTKEKSDYAPRLKAAVRKDMDVDREITIGVKEEIPPHTDEHGRSLSDSEREALGKKMKDEVVLKSKEVNQKAQALFTLINTLEGNIDVGRLLSGDFSEHADLKAALDAIGIKNFNTYLEKISKNFKKLDVNYNSREIQSKRLLDMLVDPTLLATSVVKLGERGVRDLLEKTKYYRVAGIVDRFADSSGMRIDEDTVSRMKTKIGEITDGLSPVTEERDLLRLMFLNYFGLIPDSEINAYIPDQIVASAKVTKMGGWGRTIQEVEHYTASGLPKALEAFRITPAFGGEIVSDLLCAKDKTGVYLARRVGENIGRSIDFIRVYYGEGDYVLKKDLPGFELSSFKFELRKRNIEGLVRLIEKRRETLPTYMSDRIEEAVDEKELTVEGLGDIPPLEKWEKLKDIAKRSSFEMRRMNDIVVFEGVSVEDRVDYLLNGLKTGEFDMDFVVKVLFGKDEKGYDTRGSSGWDKERWREVLAEYNVSMALLRKMPINPFPPEYNLSSFSDNLFERKLLLLKEGIYMKKAEERAILEGKPVSEVGYPSNHDVDDIDIFEGMNREQKLKGYLDLAFEFAMEGGEVSLSEISTSYWAWTGKKDILDSLQKPRYSDFRNVSWGGLHNEGASQPLIISLIQELGYPLDYVQVKANEVIEKNKGRYSPYEIDKWMSLIAFCEQPGLYNGSMYELTDSSDNGLVKGLKVNVQGVQRELDFKNVDHLLLLADEIQKMPVCTYRDLCLNRLEQYACVAVNESVPSYDHGKQMDVEHPGKAFLEAKLLPLYPSAFSLIGLNAVDWSESGMAKYNRINRQFFPKSEKYLTDAFHAFYPQSSEAVSAWSELVRSDRGLRNPFSVNYRTSDKIASLDADTRERTILYDRLRFVRDMPNCELKELLVSFGLLSAYDKLSTLKDPTSLGQELEILVTNLTPGFKTASGRQSLFEVKLGLKLGDVSAPATVEAVKKVFPTMGEFITYITSAIPEKTAFRDGYILLAVEAFPLKVGEALQIRELLFAGDYSTSETSVVLQRGGMELVRVVKSNEKVETRQVADLLLWLVDERRQVSTIDEFLRKANRTPAGRKLMLGLIGAPSDTEDSSFKEKVQLKAKYTLIKGFFALPLPIKRKIVAEIRKRDDLGIELASIMRAGLPTAMKESFETVGSLSSFDVTFNSILDAMQGGVENPNVKEMFYNLALGDKGVLEEPIVTNTSDFKERMERNFDGSDMHWFVDEILDLAFSRGKWTDKSKLVTRAISHSLIEAMDPVRRATVIYNLLMGLSKMDFSEPNPKVFQAKVLNIALSSFGVLGAKMGQIDQLIPSGWGSELASLKHATKPMSKLTVADIFSQEKLSDDYIIETNAGAASTACGYVVETPNGERQFSKVVRPEVKLTWKEDFTAVSHMLECLHTLGLLKVEPGPIVEQLRKLVMLELQTQREINNVVQYMKVEDLASIEARGGIRPVKMPTPRFGLDGQEVAIPEDSSVIFEELLDKKKYIELSKIKDIDPKKPNFQEMKAIRDSIDMDSVHETIVNDFLYRALQLGSWHSDLHDGNILLAKDGGIRRIISGKDMILIDFGQTGSVETAEKRTNAAKFLVGLGLGDRREVAEAIFEAVVNKNGVTIEAIENELPLIPSKMKSSVTGVIAKYPVEDYMTNFLKASINVLPYLQALPRSKQFDLISPYISLETKGKLRTRLIELAMKGLPSR